MTFREAIEYLIRSNVKDQLVVVCCGIGSKKQVIKAGKLKSLRSKKFNVYPQCLIIPGKLHFIEKECLENLS